MKDVKRAQDLIGSEVYDQEGDKIGRVGNVYVDDATHQPEWVTVRTGMFGTKETFVPLAGASSGDKGINVGVTKNKVKDAPKIATQHGHLSDKEGQDLYSYYGLQRGTGMSEQSTEQMSQDNGSDKGSGAGMATGAAAGGAAAGGAAASSGRSDTGEKTERMPSETAGSSTGSTSDMPRAEGDVPRQSMSSSPGASSSGSSPSGGTTGAATAAGAGAGMAGARSSSTSDTSSSETRSSRDTSDTSLSSEDTTSMSTSGSTASGATASASPSATAEKTSERESSSDPAWRMRAPEGRGGQHRAEESSATGSRSGMSTASSGTIPHEMTRMEERLRVDTENVESGRVHLRKYVVTEQETVTVPLSHEEVRIERHPITDAERSSMKSSSTAMEIGESDEEIVLHSERPVVNKESVPVERVTVNTEMVTEEQTVRGEVRKEQFDIDDSSGRSDSSGRDRKGSSGSDST